MGKINKKVKCQQRGKNVRVNNHCVPKTKANRDWPSVTKYFKEFQNQRVVIWLQNGALKKGKNENELRLIPLCL